MIIITGTFHIKSERWEEAVNIVKELIAKSREDEGCIRYTFSEPSKRFYKDSRNLSDGLGAERVRSCLGKPGTLAGLEAARARGRKGGRPAATKKMSVADLERARALYASQTMSVTEIMKRTGFRSRTTFYIYVVNVERQS